MKQRLILLAVMLVLSAGAFGLGWTLKSQSSPAPDGASQSIVSTAPVPSVVPSDRANPNGESAQKGARASSPVAQYLTRGMVTSENMGLAMQAMMAENDPLKKASLFTALLEQLTPENAKAAFEALSSSRGQGRGGWRGGGDEMRLLLNAWGRIDGETAIAELTAIEEQRRAEREANGEEGGRGGRRGGGWDRDGGGNFDIMSALTGWATTDANKAMAYVNTLEDDDRRKGMFTSGIVRGLMVNGIDEAVEFIAALPEDERNSRGRYMFTVAEEMLEQGVASAAKWVDTLKDEGLKQGALDRVAGQFAREDLEGAIEWVTQYAHEDYASRAVSEIAERWAESDPEAVINWASKLPDATQSRVYQEALNEWTDSDPVAASEYLNRMPPSPVKDSAVEGFARELAGEDPESAAVWASTISNEELRTETLVDVARNWYRTDRSAAAAWLPNSGLSPEVQQAITERGGRGGDWGRGGDFRGRRR